MTIFIKTFIGVAIFTFLGIVMQPPHALAYYSLYGYSYSPTYYAPVGSQFPGVYSPIYSSDGGYHSNPSYPPYPVYNPPVYPTHPVPVWYQQPAHSGYDYGGYGNDGYNAYTDGEHTGFGGYGSYPGGGYSYGDYR